MNAQAEQTPYVHVPVTVSPEAQAFLATLRDPHLIPRFPEPTDIAGWEKLQEAAEAEGVARSEVLLRGIPHTVTPGRLGEIPVLDVRPKDWTEDGKVLVYTHGGAHTMYSARSTLGRAAIAAHSTGLRVVSVDYTLAPRARFDRISDEVVAAIQALVEQGIRLENMAIYGDSSGGGLAAAVILKMRDRTMGMPKAAVLVSPWLDVTSSGDTETTLHDADPNQLYERHTRFAAAAYADVEDQKHPYVSPVYGDFSAGFPPTLIQGGLKETNLSGFVRMYQGLEAAGVPVKLDLYEGMIHNFQDRIPDAPESILARRKMRDFLRLHLKP
ncbi:alpha/beta hydrolase [Aquisphaera insulae]|uniref:alpha/beta hydrolase n=1 Tax=Aquisphaera insulae TaxID=2712864 RepID=UPI0013ED70E4|nr:alpha/beta hydrolase [Aquisphaera insulae]